MTCPHCEKLGLTSTLRQNGGAIIGQDPKLIDYFFDKDGKEHGHNSNSTTVSYACSEGHVFTVKQWPKCWCGWMAGEETVIS